ncbi:MAG: PEP-CTERM sorting domain-containing protein [Gammaproteobacteria bacterium]
MRKHLLISAALALAAGLGLASFGAQATPITTVDLSGCGGHFKCTNSGVTFQGWELKPSDKFGKAKLTYKADGPNETGLGVACTYSSNPKCGQDEINNNPFQYISASLGFSFSSLSVGVGSVDSGGDPGYETAAIYGSTCANYNKCGVADLLDSYTFNGTNKTWTFDFTSADLSSFSYLYVTTGGGENFDNILLASLSYTVSVPEPAELGMFGLGVLLIGLFAGLRRRMR